MLEFSSKLIDGASYISSDKSNISPSTFALTTAIDPVPVLCPAIPFPRPTPCNLIHCEQQHPPRYPKSLRTNFFSKERRITSGVCANISSCSAYLHFFQRMNHDIYNETKFDCEDLSTDEMAKLPFPIVSH